MSARKVSQNQYCVLIDNTQSIVGDTILYYLLDNDNIKDIVYALEDIISTQNDVNIIKIIKNTGWEATNVSSVTNTVGVINIISKSVSAIIQKAKEYPMITFILINNGKEIIFIDNKNNDTSNKDDRSKLEININSILTSVQKYINTMEENNEKTAVFSSKKPMVPTKTEKSTEKSKVSNEPDKPKVSNDTIVSANRVKSKITGIAIL